MTDLPRDAGNLFPSRDVSGLIQCRRSNDSAVSSAFSYFPVFLETGVMRNKIKKSICSSLRFQGRMYWGAAELEMLTRPNPIKVLQLIELPLNSGKSAKMIDLIFLSETLFM